MPEEGAPCEERLSNHRRRLTRGTDTPARLAALHPRSCIAAEYDPTCAAAPGALAGLGRFGNIAVAINAT